MSVSFKDVNIVHTPQLEQLKISELKIKNNLVRKIKLEPKSTSRNQEPEIVTPNTDGKVVFLAPGPSLGSSQNNRKRQAIKQNENSLPVEVNFLCSKLFFFNSAIVKLYGSLTIN